METIKECAILYRGLLNKKYHIILEKDIDFVLEFSPSYFYHLLGLEKLTDITQLRGKSPNKVYKDIINDKIKHSAVQKSKHYAKISDRIKYFDILPELLQIDKSNKIIVDFDKSKLNFDTYLVNTKYMLYKRSDIKYIHLTIGSKNILYPETFIVETGSTYVSEQITLDILDIKITERQPSKSTHKKSV